MGVFFGKHDYSNFVTKIYKTANLEAGRALGDELRALGHAFKEINYDDKSLALGGCLLQLGEFQRAIEDYRSKLDTALNSGVGVPVDKWIDNIKNGQVIILLLH